MRIKPTKATLRAFALAITAIICTLAILSAVFPFPESSQWNILSIGTSQKVSANPGWLSGYSYRNTIPITNSTGAGVNYTVKVAVYKGSGSNSNGVIYLGDNCTSFPSDIRFTDNDGVTELGHWYETNVGSNTTYRNFWIKVTDNLTSDQSIDIYYGKAGASSASNIDNAFLFGDDFVGNETGVFDASNDAPAVQVEAPDYVTTGMLVTFNSTDGLLVFSEGPQHGTGDHKITKKSYNIAAKTWGSCSTVYDSAYMDINAAGGLIGSTLFTFFGRYNYTASAWFDIGYIKSTDFGQTWSDYTAIDISPFTTYQAHGHITQVTNVTGTTYYLPFYGSYTGNNTVKLFKSTDDGATWSVGPMICTSASIQYSETCIEFIGNNKLIAIIRTDGAATTYQSTSSDGGDTWTTPVSTELAYYFAGHGTYYESSDDLIILTFTENAAYTSRFAIADASELYSDKDAWYDLTTMEDDSQYHCMGFIQKVGTRTYFALWTREDGGITNSQIEGSYIISAPSMTIDTSKWSGDTSSFGISANSELTNTPIASIKKIYHDIAVSSTVLVARIKTTDASTDLRWGLGYRIDASNRVHFNRRDNDAASKFRLWGDGSTYWSNTPPQWTSGTYGIDQVIIKTTHDDSIHSFDGTTVTGVLKYNLDIDNGVTICSYGAGTTGIQYMDWLYVRKYVSPEPIVGTAGSEEPFTIEITNTPNTNAFGVLEVNTSANTAINYFTLNNTGDGTVDVVIYGTDLTGGDDTWDLSDTATPGENVYGLCAGLDDDDDLFDIIVKEVGSTPYNYLVENLEEGITQGWGLNISMPTSVSGYDAQQMSGTITLVASAA